MLPEPVYYQDGNEPPGHAWRWKAGAVVSERAFKTRRGAVDDFARYRLGGG